ncbi:hypothetical protein ACN2XU_06620 [Primorskyibacter sp. 2E107]|uniref:hypothetical protein n=1 Tax=Primorskyibacter sp. 2E107 TaxID=3403458 RepID=UPI003AF5BCB2
MRDFYYHGVLIPTDSFPQFCIPLFETDQARGLVIPTSSNGRVTESFQLLPRGYEKRILGDATRRMKVMAGDPEVFSFFNGTREGITGDRREVEKFIELHIDYIQKSPSAHLSALRFIGSSKEAEYSAIVRLSNIIENAKIREHFLSIELKTSRLGDDDDDKLDRYIEELSESPNFSSTHRIISQLMARKSSFRHRHFKTALRASLENNQVYWIAEDSDVAEFIEYIVREGRLMIAPEERQKLNLPEI